MTNIDIVRKLIGPVMPVGETHIDEERLKNLQELINLVEGLLYDIDDVAHPNVSQSLFASKKACGLAARTFLKGPVKDLVAD